MNANTIVRVMDNLKNSWEAENSVENMEKSEKILSVGAGAFIFLKGISNIFSSPLLAVAEVAIGGGLLYRGLTGYCPMKDLAEPANEETVLIRETYIAETPGTL